MTSVLEAVEILKESSEYRVLSRFTPDPAVYLRAWPGETPPECKTGLYVDTETTGLDTSSARIIALAAVPFTFDPDGIVYDAGKGLSFLEDPKEPLADEIVELTGLTDAELAGQRIDDAQVEELVAQSVLVISHHAGFDRRMLERRLPIFREKPWGCSWIDVDWQKAYGTRAGRLEIILSDVLQQFHAAHRAVDDCHVGVHLLANAIAGGRTALSYLLESTRKLTYRVWAEGSDFMAKDKLKARGYEWRPDETGRKCWFKDVHAADVDDEMMFARDIGGATPQVTKFGAKDRYSTRAGR